MGSLIIPMLPTRGQRLGEGKELAKGHTGRKRLSLEISPASLAPKLILTEHLLCIMPCSSQGMVHTENSSKETA